MDASRRLKWAEGLFLAGGEGNVQLAIQDLKLLVRESLHAVQRDPGLGQPRAAPPLEASLEAHAILGDLDRLGAASRPEEALRIVERVDTFRRRWTPPAPPGAAPDAPVTPE